MHFTQCVVFAHPFTIQGSTLEYKPRRYRKGKPFRSAEADALQSAQDNGESAPAGTTPSCQRASQKPGTSVTSNTVAAPRS